MLLSFLIFTTFLFFRDGDFIFFVLMEYEKACMASSADLGPTKFLGTVVSKFTSEAINVLRKYLATMPDVNNVKTLLLRAQKFADAGMTVARRALDRNVERREKHALLVVSHFNRVAALRCTSCGTN